MQPMLADTIFRLQRAQVPELSVAQLVAEVGVEHRVGAREPQHRCDSFARHPRKKPNAASYRSTPPRAAAGRAEGWGG